MSVPVATGLVYDDLSRLDADERLRHELIDGELYVSPSPVLRHQAAVMAVAAALHALPSGVGRVYPAPTDVVLAADTVVVPDVVWLSAASVARLGDVRFVDVVPDLLVEVSSPSTRRLDLVKKRAVYERVGVAEFWFVDLEVDRVDVYRLDASGHYGMPVSLGVGDELSALSAPGLALPVAAVLAG